MFNSIKEAWFVIGRRILFKSKLSRRSRYINHKKISVGARVSVGENCVLYPILKEGSQDFDASIVIAEDVYIGHHTQLHCIGKMHIDAGAVISDYVYISDVSHGLLPPEGLIMKQPLSTKGPIHIGQNCFVGYGASVMPGVTLGDYAIVSARAVVTKSVPPYTMVAGNPARVIKIFDLQQSQWINPSENSSERIQC